MSSDDFLFTVAELSVALAGFSGVVIGIRGAREGALARQDLFGLLHILGSSGAAMTFSLLPSALGAAGVDPLQAGNVTSLLLGALVLVASIGWGISAGWTGPRYPVVFYSFVVAGVALGIGLLTTSIGIVSYAATLLPLVLLWLLLVAFAQFVTFLMLAWASPD